MILIADSGSSKTDWCFISQEEKDTHTFKSTGINPYFLSEEEISAYFKELPVAHHTVKEIYFYGAGLGTERHQQIVSNALKKVFQEAHPISVQGDLLGAAISLFQHSPGIACILGTGANSCVYNGEQINRQVKSLGYLLSDWGSGAVLGKELLEKILTGQTSSKLAKSFFQQYEMSTEEMIHHIYRGEKPNKFLAQFAPFLKANYGQDAICTEIVNQQFIQFFEYYILSYPEAKSDVPIRMTGSIAFHFQDVIKHIAHSFGLEIDLIQKSPLEGLVEFHKNLH